MTAVELDLTDAQKGQITAAIQRQRQVRSICSTSMHAGGFRQIRPTDKPTPAAAKYQTLSASWNPVLDKIFAGDVHRPQIGGVPRVLAPMDAPNKPPPPPPSLPTQLGPFNWNPITFNGTDAHGQVQLTLYSNGAYNFNGNFTDPDIYDLDDSLVFTVLDSTGVLYVFSHSGSMTGWGDRWLEGGSETDSWNNQGSQADIQAGWPALCAGYHWQANAGVNFDIGSLWNDVQKIVNAISTIVKIVQVVGAL